MSESERELLTAALALAEEVIDAYGYDIDFDYKKYAGLSERLKTLQSEAKYV